MARPACEDQPKTVRWVGGSKEDLSEFPIDVRRRVGGALWEAQIGRKAPYAKPLKGYGDAGVLEIVDDFDGAPSGPYTPCGSPRPSTSCTPSKRNRSAASPPRRPSWT